MTNPHTKTPDQDAHGNPHTTETETTAPEADEETHEIACCLKAVTRASQNSDTYPEDVARHFALLTTMEIELTPQLKKEVERFRNHYEDKQSTYLRVAQQTGIPAMLIAAIHWRESGGNFSKSIQDGKTDVPTHQWEEHAVEFLNNWNQGYNDLAGRLGLDAETTDPAIMAAFAERWNGTYYRKKQKNSPYVYSGSNHGQNVGKYVSDGEYREDHVDKQPGVALLIATIQSSEESSSPALIDGPIGQAFGRIAGSTAADARFNKNQLTHYLEHVLGFPNDGMLKGIKRGKTADTIIGTLDTNGDGWVTWSEFTTITQSLYDVLVDGKPMSDLTPEAIRQDAGEFFDAIPGSSDGLLNLTELQQHAETLVPDDTDYRELVAQLMARLALDVINQDESTQDFDDRTISRDEWIEAVMQIAPSVL